MRLVAALATTAILAIPSTASADTLRCNNKVHAYANKLALVKVKGPSTHCRQILKNTIWVLRTLPNHKTIDQYIIKTADKKLYGVIYGYNFSVTALHTCTFPRHKKGTCHF